MRTAAQGYEDFKRVRFFTSLDGLRCVSILSVMVYHAVGVHVEGVLSRGYLGVALFFAISGFLITTLLLREQEASGGIDLKRFYIRRSLRIFPLYYAVLGVYVALVVVLERNTVEGAEFFRNLPAFLTYTSNWFVPPEEGHRRIIFVFAWSLATEEQFYLLWPWVVRRGRGGWGPVVFMLGLLGVRLGAGWAVEAGVLPAQALGARVATSIAVPICLGCLGAYLLHWQRSFERAWGLLGQGWSAPLAAGLLAVSVAVEATPYLVHSLAMVLVVLTCCVRQDHGLRPLLTGRAVAYVGSISYGLYLLHLLAHNVARRLLPPGPDHWLHCAGMLVLALAMAALSYRFFESPFLRLKERFAWEAPRSRPATPAAG